MASPRLLRPSASATPSHPSGGGTTATTAQGTVTEHPLALKVMRLTRPTLATPILVHGPDPDRDLSRDVLLKEAQNDANVPKDIESLALGQAMVLPQSFGNIYLGETFSSYVCLRNDSTETCSRVNLRCDLQTASQRIQLYDPSAEEEFESGSSIDYVLNHEVKELGTHILVCEVTYSQATGKERMNFRKFFKFQVMKPLDVKTKFYNAESDEVFLEAQVQNVTTGPLCLEKVVLEPSQLFAVTSLNHVDEECRDSVFGQVNCVKPQDSRQYLFCLTPKPEVKANHKLMRGVTNIGKLDIVWRTSMGDRGRLQTSQLQRMAPNHGDVRFTIDTIPSIVEMDAAFEIVGKIINNCDRTLELDLNCLDVNQPRMMWSGTTKRKLGLVEPSGTLDVHLHVVPHDTGLQAVSGVRITDSLLKRTYEFDDLCQVYVCHPKALIKSIAKVSL